MNAEESKGVEVKVALVASLEHREGEACSDQAAFVSDAVLAVDGARLAGSSS